jgi:hypothetical protein
MAKPGWVVGLGVSLLATEARAGDVWLGLGVSEVATIPDVEHAGVYAFGCVTLPLEAGPVWIIPGLGAEYSPDLERGGATASLTVERTGVIGENVAADLIASFIHDQGGSWSGATFSYGLGVGASITIGSIVVSPALYAYRTIDYDGWTAAPTLTVSFAL